MKLFSISCRGTKILRSILVGYKSISLKNFGCHLSEIERKVNRHLEMMSHLSIYLCCMRKDFWMGVLNHLAERWWDTETLPTFKTGYEIFSNCVKLSSALIPRIKNDRSLGVKHKTMISLWNFCNFP